ncbi:transcriptional regulator [Marinobacter fuscus]|uniref:Transcriptional regulator n=1 Tax=Marinobacter fuscus TaxID=2109942 RepID=A0A2T1KBW4_9GAMM|nr:FMN-binding negative transcriptional regulator [Marinobacter fuscus]PSF07032.1 transcriptional regulator [Marinobacter fuscus]
MYIPKHFEIIDQDEIFSFLEENAFGQLISNVNGKIFSTHLPFLISKDKSKILGHMALQNPQHAELEGQEVLITIEGAHDYISPSWYSAPGVPTWNYQAVHIYGQCLVLKNSEELQEIVNALTIKYEAAFKTPWQPQYKPTMLGAIVGVEVTITEIQCKYKLSQNRPSEDREKVIEQLKAVGSNKLAEAMVRNEL